ncbi:hypothetical protein [Paracoccus salsus]|uniref:hypothetical protein n=1 Tax=Paracoccus salsus TaxID=2911061 RepID=UPI001F309B52|nr:hypothetical protein [Paracoccus salsus]MCF3973204.1 hypothetical protein [Paracoccus salsus]
MGTTNRASRIAGAVAIGFGLLTIASGGATLLGGLDMGRVVGFVLWFNTLAGLAYVAAGLGLWRGRPWAFALSLAIFVATVLVFAGFGLHVAQGGAFEMRTVFAMTLRSAVWGVIALVARLSRPPMHRG